MFNIPPLGPDLPFTLDVSAFVHIGSDMVAACNSLRFTYKQEDISAQKLALLMLRLHEKNQDYQIRQHKNADSEAPSRAVLDRIFSMEDKLFPRCKNALMAIGRVSASAVRVCVCVYCLLTHRTKFLSKTSFSYKIYLH